MLKIKEELVCPPTLLLYNDLSLIGHILAYEISIQLLQKKCNKFIIRS